MVYKWPEPLPPMSDHLSNKLDVLRLLKSHRLCYAVAWSEYAKTAPKCELIANRLTRWFIYHLTYRLKNNVSDQVALLHCSSWCNHFRPFLKIALFTYRKHPNKHPCFIKRPPCFGQLILHRKIPIKRHPPPQHLGK